MNISLSVLDRLTLPSLKIKSGTIIENEMMRSLINKFRFTEREIELYEIKTTSTGSVSWNPSKSSTASFELEDHEVMILKKGVEQRDSAGEITDENLDLAKRILALTDKPEEVSCSTQ